MFLFQIKLRSQLCFLGFTLSPKFYLPGCCLSASTMTVWPFLFLCSILLFCTDAEIYRLPPWRFSLNLVALSLCKRKKEKQKNKIKKEGRKKRKHRRKERKNEGRGKEGKKKGEKYRLPMSVSMMV